MTYIISSFIHIQSLKDFTVLNHRKQLQTQERYAHKFELFSLKETPIQSDCKSTHVSGWYRENNVLLYPPSVVSNLALSIIIEITPDRLLMSIMMVLRIFDMVQKDLRDTLANPKLLQDEETILKLFAGLASVGYAMQEYKDSRPASGAEHMVSHIWEMNHLSLNGNPVSHGFKVAIGTLISTAFITELLKLSTKDIKELIEKHKPETWEEREQKIQTAFEDSPALEGALKMSKAKFTKDLTKRHQILIKNWEKIKEKVTKQIIPFEELKAMYIEAKVPTQPKEIAVTKELFTKGVTLAQMIRTRYTSFDLAYELGLFESILRTVQENYFSEFAK
jgi:glycerol-1-phosphate dehydrogenase [NAD(P)+]